MTMHAWLFTRFEEEDPSKTSFEKLFALFSELLLYTSGDVTEALSWMNEIDRTHKITTPEYGMADFIQDLLDRGFLKVQDRAGSPAVVPAALMEQAWRKQALDEIFTDLKKSRPGKHSTRYYGQGDEKEEVTRPYTYGDPFEHIAITTSLQNAHLRSVSGDIQLTPGDLEVYDTALQVQTSTALLIDISHSMILYGEDRITPAKKVAMALAEWMTTRYPKDTLDIIVFGDDAWTVDIKDLPYLQVGPYHTNTVAGLELGMEVLRKRRNPNKQIFMITDGKPTCIRKGKRYYKNSYGLDRQILRRTLGLAQQARKLQIPITTFMIARDPWLVRFVDEFTRVNAGKAYYAGLEGLGSFVFRDYKENPNRKGR